MISLNLKDSNESIAGNGPVSGCTYLQRFKRQPLNYESYGFKHPVWDIEDLVYSFKRKRVIIFFSNVFI